ncbi:MAG: amidohydrolase family protein [Proteobacteria bacterium]|nr:amidohydrolase family protein [Pseudomonadota bacterium]
MSAARARLAAAAGALLLAAGALADTLAIVHARAFTGDGDEPLADATIVVRDGRIVALAAGLAPPGGATLVDARGRLVTAGLMNGATQLAVVEVDAVPDTNDQAVSVGPLGAAFDLSYAVNSNATALPLARADGLTRAAVLPTGSAAAPFAGQGALLHLVADGEILERPRALLAVQVGGMSAGRAGGSRAAQWGLLRNALDEARAYGRGTRPGAPRDQLLNHLDAEALQPVLAGRVPLAIAAARESDIREALRLAADYRLRVVVVGGAEAWRLAPALARQHVPVILDPFADYPATFDELGARLDNAALLERAGVTIAFTLPPIQRSHNAGSALREAAGLAVANGLPWAAALRALTLNPARIWGLDEHYGRLATGQDGDLVIWDGDPLEPASAPVEVRVAGRLVADDSRQRRLRERYAPARQGEPWPPAYR